MGLKVVRICDDCEKEFPQKVNLGIFKVEVEFKCLDCLLAWLSQEAQKSKKNEIERRFLCKLTKDQLEKKHICRFNEFSDMYSKKARAHSFYINRNHSMTIIKQLYFSNISDVSKEKRVRLIYPPQEFNVQSNKYYYTEKSGQGRVRDEGEVSIAHDVADRLFEEISGFFIHKMRYVYTFTYINKKGRGDQVFVEVNFFDYRANDSRSSSGHSSIWEVLIEIEFENEEQAENFVEPDWFDREVTADVRFTNRQIAEHGWPEEAV